jgi:hypothetical protein
MADLIPRPASVQPGRGAFILRSTASIRVEPEIPELAQVGEALAERLRPASGFRLPVVSGLGCAKYPAVTAADPNPGPNAAGRDGGSGDGPGPGVALGHSDVTAIVSRRSKRRVPASWVIPTEGSSTGRAEAGRCSTLPPLFAVKDVYDRRPVGGAQTQPLPCT